MSMASLSSSAPAASRGISFLLVASLCAQRGDRFPEASSASFLLPATPPAPAPGGVAAVVLSSGHGPVRGLDYRSRGQRRPPSRRTTRRGGQRKHAQQQQEQQQREAGPGDAMQQGAGQAPLTAPAAAAQRVETPHRAGLFALPELGHGAYIVGGDDDCGKPVVVLAPESDASAGAAANATQRVPTPQTSSAGFSWGGGGAASAAGAAPFLAGSASPKIPAPPVVNVISWNVLSPRVFVVSLGGITGGVLPFVNKGDDNSHASGVKTLYWSNTPWLGLGLGA